MATLIGSNYLTSFRLSQVPVAFSASAEWLAEPIRGKTTTLWQPLQALRQAAAEAACDKGQLGDGHRGREEA